MISTPHTWIEISKNALLHNLHMYKHMIGSQALGVVVKSNAYGHGIVEIGRICQESPDTQWLFTATLSEALLLRTHGITKPILVIYFIDADPTAALAHDISLMVCDIETLKELNEQALGHATRFKVHIKVDTGMSRFGFTHEQALDVIKYARLLPGIIIEGVYSHLAQAANADQTFNNEQEKEFIKTVDAIKEMNVHIPYYHLANSAGSTSLSNKHTNLVRLGLGAYGWWPSQSNKDSTQAKFSSWELQPVLTFKTRIIQIKHLPAHKTVGYDRTYKTSGPTTIGVLPVGYYDGYDRRLSSKGILLVKDQYAPVIGLIAMTTTLVDITHIPDAQVGDEAILMGNYEKITPTHLANVIGSFNAREIMTRLNPQLPRVVC